VNPFEPIIKSFPRMLHGGDYNPDQWLDRPDIIDEDFRLAKLAGVNTWSVGIFAWAALEPEEGRFEFGWLDRILDRMAAADMKAVLATPSGAKPNWMAAKYPEIRRLTAQGQRELQEGRHNHCYTSPIYREKVTIMNTRLAERYQGHPALGIWHLSNEYNGDCHCNFCMQAFREWLKRKYGTLERLNKVWWTSFWSHIYSDWAQIEAIDCNVHGLVLDWKRFASDQTADFIRCEAAPLRRLTPTVPITTNLMGTFLGLDYRRLAKELDVLSWDCYPFYHERPDMEANVSFISFVHDLNRCMKGGRPFMMMESSPSAVNWMPINRLLRPGMHRIKSLQAVAHGSDSVQYFQWRKGRGSCEKFHGAVVDHVGHEGTRVFADVAEVGKSLSGLGDVVGAVTPSEVAIIYDWENRWILNEVQGPPKKDGLCSLFEQSVRAHYLAFWKQGVSVDVVASTDDLSRYKVVVAPMLYMLQPGVSESLTAFVRNGGTLVSSFLTGITDENDLVFEGGWPGPLRPLFGVWAEEIDYLYPDEANRMVMAPGTQGLAADYGVTLACDLIHAEGAKVLATYGSDFYAGRPALTVNTVGKGKAYYIAAFTEQKFSDDFHRKLVDQLGIKCALPRVLPEGVTAQVRTDGRKDFVFVMNFARDERTVDPGEDRMQDLLTGKKVCGPCKIEGYGCRVWTRQRV